jgi:hypothetical protein
MYVPLGIIHCPSIQTHPIDVGCGSRELERETEDGWCGVYFQRSRENYDDDDDDDDDSNKREKILYILLVSDYSRYSTVQ